MDVTRCRLVIELQTESGELLGHARIRPAWEPAIECTRLFGLRSHGVWAPEASAVRSVDAIWHPDRGQPYLSGVRVHFWKIGTAWHDDFGPSYFIDLARSASTQFVERGILAVGDRFRYHLLAYEEPDAADPELDLITTVDQLPTLPVRTVEHLLQGSPAVPDDADSDDPEVFIPQNVLDECTALTLAAGEIEGGGILIGHLDRESGTRDIAVEVTAFIPAPHTVASSEKLTFTSETWTDVRHAIALRSRGELMLGWSHWHPQFAWCKKKGCSIEDQWNCTRAKGFFSEQDVALHEAVFPRAFTIALVMTHSAAGVMPRLFGWRHGRIQARGFRVPSTPSSTLQAGATTYVPVCP